MVEALAIVMFVIILGLVNAAISNSRRQYASTIASRP